MLTGQLVFSQLMHDLPIKASHAELAQHLVGTARALYAHDTLNGPLLGRLKAAVKLHTLLDLRGAIPSFIYISHGKVHDVKMLELNLPHSLHDILRQLDLNMFKTIPITQLLGLNDAASNQTDHPMQANLF